MNTTSALVCSFYTADSYYRAHAQTLRRGLERLGLEHELEEIEIKPGEEWPDICRKKIPFLASVCERNPDKKVYWIDVDCQLLEFPAFIADFSADLIGFQRGFGSPLGIGYGKRTRFWEPCFFGINTSAAGRKFMADAKVFETNSGIRATDDYFFEESWRANANYLSFQLVPSLCVVSKSENSPENLATFFSFGASGNVSEFKDKVVQHKPVSSGGGSVFRVRDSARSAAKRAAKAIEHQLPQAASVRLRKLADSAGATQFLTGGGADATSTASLPVSHERTRIIERIIMSAQRGDYEAMNTAYAKLGSTGIEPSVPTGGPLKTDLLIYKAAESFAHYASDNGDRIALPLTWWPRPFPGNFGDWLSPFVINYMSGQPVKYVSPTAKSNETSIVAIGSIGRFIKPRSIVVGTGVSSTDLLLDKRATYHSVRGPITAELLLQSGGPKVESFGDPGVLLSRLLPMERGTTNGRLALVRHFTHAKLPLMLPDDVDEIDVLMSHPDAIRRFVAELHAYEGVVTSAMHVMIACHSYGIPCALISFDGFESAVHGTGIKYADYSQGAGLEVVHEPRVISIDLSRQNLRDLLSETKISKEKLDEVEGAMTAAMATLLERHPWPSARA